MLHFNAKQMPMLLSGIRSFIVRNRCSIYIYQIDGRKLINIYSSKNNSQRRKVNVLILVDGKPSHFCLIKNFSNHIHHLSRSPQKRSSGPKSRFCRNCYQPVLKQNMARHSSFCESNDPFGNFNAKRQSNAPVCELAENTAVTIGNAWD